MTENGNVSRRGFALMGLAGGIGLAGSTAAVAAAPKTDDVDCMSPDDAASRALAKIECAELLTRYSLALDRHPLDAFDFFAEDGIAIMPPDKRIGGEQLRKLLEMQPTDVATRHLLTNVLVTLTGPDTADVFAYVMYYEGKKMEQPPHELPAVPNGAANWNAGLVRTEDGWKIARMEASLFMVPNVEGKQG